MGSVPEVVIDPRFRLPYQTYVLQGIADAGIVIRFRHLRGACGEGMSLQYRGRRFYVDTNDPCRIEQQPYDWADVVGKVNVDPPAVLDPKVRVLGPVFSVRLWRLPAGYLQLPRLAAAGAPIRATIAGLRFQGLRANITRPLPKRGRRAGIHLSPLRDWRDRHLAASEPRRRFAEAVQRTGIAHEITITDRRISHEEYLRCTIDSTLVFNSPAVHACLGWKLGEYLALGKAIISTPLDRALPAPLVHGRHIHFVRDDVDAMAAAVELVNGDDGYRRTLEVGARAWYEQYLRPAAVAQRLLDLEHRGAGR